MEEQLASIGEASSKVQELHECLTSLTQDVHEFESNESFLTKCEHCALSLESERKAHAEELRLINQDINHLEDILKNLRASQETKKSVLSRKITEFQIELHRTNAVCKNTGIPDSQLLDFTIMGLFRDVTNGNVEMEPAIRQNNFATLFPPHPFLFPRPATTTKEKSCANCNQRIHRNSPICPFCKCKSVSKCRRYIHKK